MPRVLARSILAAAMAHVLVASPAASQTATVGSQSPPQLTLDSMFVDRAWEADSLSPARWLDGDSYTTLEASVTVLGSRDLVRHDAASGDSVVLVGAHELLPGSGDQPLEVESYDWSPDGRQLLIFTNSRRVWRSNTRGDYWILDTESRTLERIGGAAGEATLMFAKFSPDSTRVAYVRANDLYMENLRGGEASVITRLTHDGSNLIANGTSDWVYEEELGVRDGFRWSPDGSHIAFGQLNDSGVREFTLIDDTSELYPVLHKFPYPKAGETNPAARVGVVPAAGGDVLWVDLPGDTRDNYVARMEWAGGPDELVIQQIDRRQNNNRVFLADVRTGEASQVLLDTDEAWVDVVNDLRWLDGGRAFTFVSERDGWRRVYRVARDGSSIEPLTPAGVDVMGIEFIDVDPGGGWLYYASTSDATQRYLHRVPLTADDEIVATALTPTRLGGTHRYDIAPGGRWAFHTWSSFETPPQVALVELPDHRTARVLVNNTALRDRFSALERPPAEFFRVEVEPGVELDAWVIYPDDFDPALSYPVLFHVYGEPAGQTVLDRWGGRNLLWHHLVAQRGYVVMSVDNRGTPSPRGRQWRKVVYGEVGTLAAKDQAAAVHRILQNRPYIDPTRVGIWGWSGGGSMTLNALFRYPDVYATGMSVAPVPDQRYYDTIYQELYMGTPQNNPDGYRNGSPITYADRLEGNLLLVHGTGDDNVHYQGTEALINRLVESGKPFSMMTYPNRTHAIREGAGTTRHLYGLLTRYLMDNLPAGPTALRGKDPS